MSECIKCGSSGQNDANFHCAMCYRNLEERVEKAEEKTRHQRMEIIGLCNRLEKAEAELAETIEIAEQYQVELRDTKAELAECKKENEKLTLDAYSVNNQSKRRK